jgi:hypothetical protein
MASFTIWSRLEPRTRKFGMEQALQAQVRDALWMLARQWQVGEFLGDDAGSPISATVRTESVRLTSFQPGAAGAAEPLAGHPPIEVNVQREPIASTLREAVALGLRFEALLRDGGVEAHAPAFRHAFPVATEPPATEVSDPAARAHRLLAAGRVPDGERLVVAARAAADLKAFPPVAAAPGSARQALADALAALIAYRDSLYSEPSGDGSWIPDQLEHEFAVGSESQAGAVTLRARQFRSEQLDWHSLSADADSPAAPGGEPVLTEQRSFIPTNVSFRGMPSSRWWNFEDGATDFGKLDAENVDLAKLVVMEFALVYGDDWFNLPLPLPVGALSHVAALVVADTFGGRTALRPTGEQVPEGERPWSMFGLTGVPPDRDLLLLAPTLGAVLDGPELEQVLFARDEMAAMSWAVERTLQGGLDAPVDGYELYRRRLAATPPPPPRTRKEGEPPIEYEVGSDVPDNWIPLVPVQTSTTSFVYRRGVMGGPGGHPARGRILEPEHPFYVAEEAIPREGVEVTRRYRRARWSDGSTYLWMARRAHVGRGGSGSGLEFDTVRDVPKAP